MNIAEASLDEALYYLILAQDLGYAEIQNGVAQAEAVSRILRAYASSILAGGE
jgi:four helix bundle protein